MATFTRNETNTFLKVGGRPVLPHPMMKGVIGAVGEKTDPRDSEAAWNFGLFPKPAKVQAVIKAKPTLYAKFPAMQGKWDGKTTVNHFEAAVKVLGNKAEELIQQQPRGTCGGRAGSATMDLVQCVMIAAGKRAKFHRTSHAAVYYFARKLYDMTSGNWQDENNDGVASGSVPEALSKIGADTREEAGDDNYYGGGSDDLACKLGAGQMSELGKKLEQLASDNIIKDWAPVTSAAELADGIAGGGIGIGSDSQGFTMQRDSQGFCRRSGRWDHYQTRVSVQEPGFGYWQSWGRETPSGPKLPGHPGNCFGVAHEDQDYVIKHGDWAVVFGFEPFELEKGDIDIPWVFAGKKKGGKVYRR